jgi:hypothetical protein
MLTAYRVTKLFNLASLHLSKCSVDDEIKKYEIDRQVARIRGATCLHSILACRSDENAQFLMYRGRCRTKCEVVYWIKLARNRVL